MPHPLTPDLALPAPSIPPDVVISQRLHDVDLTKVTEKWNQIWLDLESKHQGANNWKDIEFGSEGPPCRLKKRHHKYSKDEFKNKGGRWFILEKDEEREILTRSEVCPVLSDVWNTAGRVDGRRAVWNVIQRTYSGITREQWRQLYPLMPQKNLPEQYKSILTNQLRAKTPSTIKSIINNSREARIRAHFESVMASEAVKQQSKRINEYSMKELQNRYTDLCKLAKRTLDCEVAILDTTGEGHFIAANQKELANLFAREGVIRKPVLFRDWDWLSQRPSMTCQEFIAELGQTKRGYMVDIQDFGDEELLDYTRPRKKLKTTNRVHKRSKETLLDGLALKTDQVTEIWNSPREIPINLLNIESKTASPPLAILKNCKFLTKATEFDSSRTKRALNKPNIGKTHMKSSYVAVDIESSLVFAICSQAGSISGWHMDNIGPYTWVNTEGTKISFDAESIKRDDDFVWSDSDLETIKLWAIIAIHSLPEKEQDKIREAFAKEGDLWEAPKEYIKIIPLVRGDTFIMPSGTIHSPITITDCYMSGGVCIPDEGLKATIDTWKFLIQNPICTNENQPKQARSILAYAFNRVSENPQRFGWDVQTGREDFLKDMKQICEGLDKCGCKPKDGTGCNKNTCSCYSDSQPCSWSCHQKTDIVCMNPNGCFTKLDRGSATGNRDTI